MLHTCRYTRRRVQHIWPICTAAILTYRQVQSHVISRLSTSKHVAFFKTVTNSRVRDPSAGHKLMDYTYSRWHGYHDARRNRTDRNVGNDQVVPKRPPVWTTYGALLLRHLFLLPLEAELSISKVLLPFTRQQAAFLTLKRNYQASGSIKCKFYCLFSLRCCNCCLVSLVFVKLV